MYRRLEATVTVHHHAPAAPAKEVPRQTHLQTPMRPRAVRATRTQVLEDPVVPVAAPQAQAQALVRSKLKQRRNSRN